MHGYPRRKIFRARRRLPAAMVPLLVATALSIGFFKFLSAQLRPLIETMAVSKTVNLISVALSQEVDDSLTAAEMTYSDFVDLETDASGRVTSLSVNLANSTGFKRQVVERLAARLEGIDPDELAIPLGNLTGILMLSALGPSVRVRIQSVGDVTADYTNEFTAAGVNQTVHSVYLKLSATVYLLIPGKILPVTAENRVCVAETVIIGDVPDTYLNLQKGDN